MLTLIEPPGSKRAVPTANNRSAQHLLNFAAATDDDDEVDADDAVERGAIERTGTPSLAQRIDNFLVGRSNSYGYSERWKREFSERPSWCDADMTLQQIKRGKARGNRLALYSRSLIQKALFALGSFVERHAFLVIAVVLAFFTFCCYGLQFVRIETDIVKLWVARGGRLDEELNFLTRVQQHSIGTKIKRENGLGGGYQVVIHTPPLEANNILTKEGLLEHVAIMQQIAQYRIEVAGENWTLSDICFKPPSPEIDNSSMAARYASIIDRIIPCIWITPIDCFWEGSKAIGPHPSIEASSLGIAKEFLTSLPPKERFSWSDLDPQAIVDELDELFSLGNTRSFFHRADIGKGYLDRWCIDPLDAECPRYAPNYFPFCDLIPRFLEYAKRSDFEVPIDPQYLKDEEEKMKRDNTQFNLFDFFSGKKKRDVDRIKRTLEQTNPVSLGGDSLASSITSSVNDKASMAEAPTSDMMSDVTGSLEDELQNPSSRTPDADKFNSSTIASSDATATTEHPEAARRKAEREKGERAASDEPQRGVVEQNHSEWSSAHALSDLDDLYSEEEEAAIINVTLCKKYARPMADWMKQNPEKWSEFLSKAEFPVTPDYGKVVYGGCRGFAKGVMSWPQDLIIGGARQADKKLKSAEAFQSVFLVASPNDVFLRFKDGERRHLKPNLDANLWNVTVAEEVIRTWQRNFTHNLYNHEWNFQRDASGNVKKEYRRVHPLASTSIADMLEEFCQFNYTIILIGYLLMLAYALHSQMRRHGCMLSADSCMGLAFAGVLTVTFASVAGLGLATWFGIEFNAATTQIVPFLTLGIGVDNMFLLLHNYHAVVDNVKTEEVGMLMKETGMSILMTSINNILSFLAGTLLPIPALRGFCAQSSILLTFNLLAILTIYPAIISLDLRRRKNARRDVCCCVVANELLVAGDDYSVGIGVKPHVQEKRTVGELVPSYHNLYSRNDREDDVEDDVKPWTLHAFLRHYYIPFLKQGTTKAVILFVCGCMLVAALIGIHRASYGLELSDVLPEHTAPAAFLKARDRYFSFYPMFAVLKGPNIDYARDQHKIDNYRRSIGRSHFVVKVDGGEPSEKYWLSLMRAWLRSLQTELDQAIAMGQISTTNDAIVDETLSFTGSSRKLSAAAIIAYRLTCSYGNTYNCSGRIGKMRLIDESGTINVDGFYNYVTGWYNSDSMMYHVSQASFFPTPPQWSYENSSALLVPPAEPFAYSQIPFYLTGLTDTPVIIEMIKEIRAVCDQFAKEGLPNFPSGIAFTFWEQYLHLSWHLFLAICTIAASVFLVISILIFNPWAAFMVMVVVVSMTIELAGFMGIAGVKLNPVSAVTLITAVGIGVEFTAHVVLAFLTSLGTKDERMAACMDHMFVPVIHGGLSTLLGIVMLAFSEFEFVVKYFFIVMSALIIIGLINGLALLPVLLSLVGPPCEVSPVDGTDRLPPPPALRRSRNKRLVQEMQTHRRNDSDDSNTGTLGPENCSTMLLIEPPRDGSSGPGPRLVVNTHARSASAHIAT
uniref:Protein patched 1 n=1 Tax=Ascaris suum TaxID=6253 RepID=F1KQC5_ASCSU